MNSISIVARTSDSLAQSGATELMLGLSGASLRRHDASVPDANNAIGSSHGQLDAVYGHWCALMASPNDGLLDVAPQNLQDLAVFMEARKNTLHELGRIVVLVSPDPESQHTANSFLNTIVPTSVEPQKCAVLLVDYPRNVSPEPLFTELYAGLRDIQFEGPITSAPITSRQFEEAHAHKLMVNSLVNGEALEDEFRAAREAGVSEKKLYGLSRRLMAARTVVAAAREFQPVYDALRLPCIATVVTTNDVSHHRDATP
ncbi:hypothetical protein PTKU64_23360 [Paraburkholderia terrae]|uniref:Uncharacterized protein n=1 Tax=Paraburkholderia terrae TaxID=311230 RepID=A0ABN6JD66_9BURK|nr:hypothetical protein [Paraburkholderia terrae]BCZ78661.1 hypothetical protein PTKU64_23360 [Paraburkholderia terrae]